MPYQFKEEDLTAEKSLWDVYKLSRRITPSKFVVLAIVLTMIFLGSNAFYFESDVAKILSDVRKWAEMGFSFAITTLGFLIAGFTIFATLSKPKMMLAMMDHTNKATGLPTLKYNFFAFMKIFIAYIAMALMYVLVVLFGQEGGFISNVIDLLPNSLCIKVIVVKIGYVVVGASFIYLILLLKNFVFNIYAIVMNFLRWEYHQEK